MFRVRLLAGVTLRVKVAFIREQVCLGFIVYLSLNFLLCLNRLFWVIDNSLYVSCNQCSVLNNVDSISAEKVAEVSNDYSVAELPGV